MQLFNKKTSLDIILVGYKLVHNAGCLLKMMCFLSPFSDKLFCIYIPIYSWQHSNHDNVSIVVDVFFDDKITPNIFGNILAFRDEKFAGNALVSQAIYTRGLTE